MPKQRARITRATADGMYEDVIDRVTAAVRRGPEKPPPKPAPPPSVKVTVYLSPKDVLAIDELVSHEFRKTGRRPRRSAIVSRAIQALARLTKVAEPK